MTGDPLTLGTAGHIDHGKTALVRALTGVDTDRLPEEHARGISIALGYAPLKLPSGRQLSLVDVPGHERFVKTMVAGATGVDLYLMVVAADDGVMPQTVEHAAVLDALGVRAGVVAVTKSDLADPARAEREARALLPGASAVVACSATTGDGVADVALALERVATSAPARAAGAGDPLLHLDRSFTVDGIGTIVTGTLWSGTLRVGDQLTLLPAGRAVRVRGLQVHDEPRPEARAGQRVAVNLAGARVRDISRGDVLTTPGRVSASTVLDCALALAEAARHGERVQVHHGARDTPAHLAELGDGLWQLRLEKPLLAADGDRVVVRRLSPPDTLGGGTILDATARRHGRRPEVMARLRARAAGEADPTSTPAPPVELPPAAALAPAADPNAVVRAEEELRAAGLSLLGETAIDPAALAALRAEGRAVRVSGRLYAHAEVATQARATIVALIEAGGSVSLGEARDALGTGRKPAQAFLEHLDAQRVTVRGPDDRRVLRRAAVR
jgi:selenocysteine-specific elongation factor